MIKILNKSEKREVENKLKERFGIEKIPGEIIRFGKERLYLYTGSLTPKGIISLEKPLRIERLGVYFAKIVEGEKDLIRLSIEGSQILGSQIKKNIFHLNDKQAKDWMHGKQLNIKTGKRGFFVMKHNGDFLGTGKASAEKIGNYIPKNRRLKAKQ